MTNTCAPPIQIYRRAVRSSSSNSALGGTDDLMVYTSWGERIQQDLRHELTACATA